MDRQFKAWAIEIDRLSPATAADYREAAWLVADIARSSRNEPLRRAAAQAVPCLRSAMLLGDLASCAMAQERLGVISNILRVLCGPSFGKRREPGPLGPEQRHRQRLGLPLAGHLSAPEIHRAFKRAAKTAHPDVGGSAGEFQLLSAAREALMKER
jgi:hypothetical protein